MAKPLRPSRSVASLCAAFPEPNGKSSPLLQLTQRLIHATTANSRPGFFLQTRPLSGDGIMALFKSDAQKKNEKDQENSNIVYLPHHFFEMGKAEQNLDPLNQTSTTPSWL